MTDEELKVLAEDPTFDWDNIPSSQVTVNGIPIEGSDIDRLTWQGYQTYEGMTSAKTWILKMYDGTVHRVDPKTLDSHSYQCLLAVHFPD